MERTHLCTAPAPRAFHRGVPPWRSTVAFHRGVPPWRSLQGVADYGKLGHGEVVGLRVPPSAVGGFAEAYFRLFDKGGDRPDKVREVAWAWRASP